MIEAKEKLIRAVLRRICSERDEPHANYDAELEYCDELIYEAAQNLVKAGQKI